MAEQERLTKAERRERKRQRRLEEERAAAEKAARARRRNITYAVSLTVVVGLLVWLALGNVTPDASVTITQASAEEARAASECEVLDVELITDEDMAPLGIAARQHLEPAVAPGAELLYVKGRPTSSGPHFEQPLAVVNGIRDEPVDERAVVHNLEHGSVLVWIDREQVPTEDVDAITDWLTVLNENGFSENTGRAGIMASYAEEGQIDSGAALAIRAWGVGMDCGTWDEDWANGFVIDHFGPHGIAPEQFQEYPEDALAYGDVDRDSTDDDGVDGTDTGEDTEDGGTEDGGTEDGGAGDEG